MSDVNQLFNCFINNLYGRTEWTHKLEMIQEDVLFGMKKDPLAWAIELDARNQVRVVRRAASASAMTAGASAAMASGSTEQVGMPNNKA